MMVRSASVDRFGMGKLSLHLLGEFGLQTQAGNSINITSRKARVLLGYLASRPGYSVSRVDLARMLWERHDDQQALTNLRQTLSVLNQLLNHDHPGWLIKHSGFLALNPDSFEIDIDLIQREPITTEYKHLESVVAMFSGAFLEGMAFHEEALSTWLDQQRQSLECLNIELRKRLLDLQINADNFADAVSNAETLVQLNPVDEASHCQLMSIFSSLGQRHRVMRQYQKCCQTLEQYQLGQPQETTLLLFQSLYYDTVVHPVFETKACKPVDSEIDSNASDAIPAIAVLPFNDLMQKPDAYSLSTALTEEMVNELRRFHGFKVISALSSLSLKGQNCDLKTAATMLGARYLVCGSIRQSQQKIQIAVELVDAENGELIWAERYTRKIEDLFVLQAELARDIAGNIEPEAVGHAYLLSSRKIPASLTAWDLVLRGDHQLYKQLGTRWNSNEAQRLYRMAIEQDPDYAPSYAGLAYSLCLELKEGIAEKQQHVENLMLENAKHAVRLDESNPWCQVILGRAQQQLKEYDAAVMSYRKAVELCPSSSKAQFGLSFGLSTTGQYDEAIESIDRAIELSPRDPMSWSYHTVKALTYIYSEKFDLAASSSEVSSSYITANHWAPVLLAPSLIHLGHYDKALRVLEKAKQLKPDISVHAVTKAFATRNEADTLAIQEGLMDAGLKK